MKNINHLCCISTTHTNHIGVVYIGVFQYENCKPFEFDVRQVGDDWMCIAYLPQRKAIVLRKNDAQDVISAVMDLAQHKKVHKKANTISTTFVLNENGDTHTITTFK